MGGWRDMSAEALEDHYSPSRWSPRLERDTIIDAHLAVTAAGTERARASTRTLLHVPYGIGDGEKLDIYLPTAPSERGLTSPQLALQPLAPAACQHPSPPSKDNSGFAAPPLVSQGVAVVAVGYDIAPKGHMDTMVLQVRRSLVFLVERYPRNRGIYLCGHSAGAHLAAMVLSTDWTEFQVVPDIKGAVLVSGLYDLEPILHTYVNDALNMSRQSQEYSQVSIRQLQEHGQALREAGWSVSLLDLAGVDHFDIIEKLSEDSYVLTQVILNMISRA
ncbi:Kynurenine formamidase [Lonchura striata]|uniref:Kynurenine formamidase n=1 Tax=Lonchura striata TaxID=40157 RepID=A0A218ULG2_9PASE|nr:Kynurenine formamidase [Lonchura striata domestica]